MKRHPTIHRPAPPIPSGFTLIELLVVIGIIIFLVSMTVAFVGSAITTARDKRTKATIKKIDGLLTQRMEAFTMEVNKQKPSILERKISFRNYFPQTLKEAGLNSTDDPMDVAASSEALYEFLVNGETFGAPAVDSDAFDSSEADDTNGNGRKEFLDGWGRPLRFYRWPTRLIRPAPQGEETERQSIEGTSPDENYTFPLDPDFVSAPPGNKGITASLLFGPLEQKPPSADSRVTANNANPTLQNERLDPLAKDPDDPIGSILGLQPTAANVEKFERDLHTPDTWWTPLIVSAGPDGVLGLFEPVDKDNHGHLAQPKYDELDGLLDNITNRNLQR